MTQYEAVSAVDKETIIIGVRLYKSLRYAKLPGGFPREKQKHERRKGEEAFHRIIIKWYQLRGSSWLSCHRSCILGKINTESSVLMMLIFNYS